MPEGPECRRIAESLAKFASGKKIISVEILSGRYTKKIPSGFDALKDNLPVLVAGVGVHGKFIYWITTSGVIFSTLGMTGTYKTENNKYLKGVT